MSSRRYYIATAPVSHINGKLAPVRVKCKNTYEEEKDVEGFWYGYKRHNINRYGIRQRCRDLNEHPYTAQEDENRTLFRLSLLAVYSNKRIDKNWSLMLQDFEMQKDYKTPLGFAIAMTRENGGEWRSDWIG